MITGLCDEACKARVVRHGCARDDVQWDVKEDPVGKVAVLYLVADTLERTL